MITILVAADAKWVRDQVRAAFMGRGQNVVEVTRGQDVRVLIHAEHGHPVRRVVADLDAAEHGADGIGERSASGHDDEPAAWAERGKCLRDEIEGAGFAEESTPHLDDRVNDLCLLRHEGTVS